MKKIFLSVGIYVGIFLIMLFLTAHTLSALSSTSATSTEASSPQSKEVAITFDDGPYGTSTERVLDILKKEHINATFFLIGKNVEMYPQIAQDIVREGNMIGNHSYAHLKNYRTMSARNFERDLMKGETLFASTTGLSPQFFRPPYSRISNSMKKVLRRKGFTLVLWDIDTEDWNNNISSKKIEEKVLKQVKPRVIILFHDGHETPGYSRENTISALPHVIEELKKQGYVFVTLDTLMHIPAYFK